MHNRSKEQPECHTCKCQQIQNQQEDEYFFNSDSKSHHPISNAQHNDGENDCIRHLCYVATDEISGGGV